MTVKSYVNLHEQKDKQLGIFPVSVVYSTNIFTLESPCQYQLFSMVISKLKEQRSVTLFFEKYFMNTS